MGPSPRERGSREAVPECRVVAGSIPARAGEPVSLYKSRILFRVHPRASGGAFPGQAEPCANLGPSPRERGSRLPLNRLAQGSGSIPARAGEPSARRSSATDSRVHPRASGGAYPRPSPHNLLRGPSPRERGSRRTHLPQAILGGSIPARAGEPDVRQCKRTGMWVHPRASGGAWKIDQFVAATKGPSPRERGSRGGRVG